MSFCDRYVMDGSFFYAGLRGRCNCMVCDGKTIGESTPTPLTSRDFSGGINLVENEDTQNKTP